MSKSPIKAVCYAGPIIHLDEIDVLYLLEDFHEILICPAVKDEVQKKRPNLFVSVSPPFVVLPHALPTDQIRQGVRSQHLTARIEVGYALR
jgi:hypothetical protein